MLVNIQVSEFGMINKKKKPLHARGQSSRIHKTNVVTIQDSFYGSSIHTFMKSYLKLTQTGIFVENIIFWCVGIL